jgi:GrpB-like predicted nucleotidyltransferase (UPF0157 family)
MERINDLTQLGLGILPDGPVQLKPHHARWKRAAADEAYVLYDALRLEDLRLYHIGSSAVPGLRAKPVLDFLGSVESLAAYDAKAPALTALGYEHRGEYGIAGRRFSKLKDGNGRTFAHLHVFQHGDPQVARHLAFRDLLLKNPEAREAYETEKTRIAASGLTGNDYAGAKGGLIQKLDLEAAATPAPRRVLALLGSAEGGRETENFLREKYAGFELKVVALHEQNFHAYRYGKEAEAEPAFLALVEEMIAADLVVFATPVYWYAMGASMKLFFDRLSDLLRGPHQALGERLAFKKVKLLSTAAAGRLPMGFESPFALTALYLGMDYLGADYRGPRT